MRGDFLFDELYEIQMVGIYEWWITKRDALNNCTRLKWKSFFFDLFGQRKRLERKAGGKKPKRDELPALILVVGC